MSTEDPNFANPMSVYTGRAGGRDSRSNLITVEFGKAGGGTLTVTMTAERAKWLSESIGRTLYPEFPDWFYRLNHYAERLKDEQH